jgi:hypothetical protein
MGRVDTASKPLVTSPTGEAGIPELSISRPERRQEVLGGRHNMLPTDTIFVGREPASFLKLKIRLPSFRRKNNTPSTTDASGTSVSSQRIADTASPVGDARDRLSRQNRQRRGAVGERGATMSNPPTQ